MEAADPLKLAEAGIAKGEIGYMKDWQKDAENWEQLGLYSRIAELVAPREGGFVADIGTGLGQQLLWLCAQNSRGLYLGTERTPYNVVFTRKYIQSRSPGAVSAMLTQKFVLDEKGCLVWLQRDVAELVAMRSQFRKELGKSVLILDDDIRRPGALPAILGKDKLDAAIHSMPGGSGARPYEWPYRAEKISSKEAEKRDFEVTQATRAAFWNYASCAVRLGGKAVTVERACVAPESNLVKAGLMLLIRAMQSNRKYWDPDCVVDLDAGFELSAEVELRSQTKDGSRTQDDLHAMGRSTHAVIFVLLRNSVPFDGPPPPTPDGQ